jgi:hypothetical protein
MQWCAGDILYLSHFPTESDAFKFTFDGQGCATGTVAELTDTGSRQYYERG